MEKVSFQNNIGLYLVGYYDEPDDQSDSIVLNKKYVNTELFVIGIKDEDLHRERIFDKCKDRPEHLSRFQEYFSCIRKFKGDDKLDAMATPEFFQQTLYNKTTTPVVIV